MLYGDISNKPQQITLVDYNLLFDIGLFEISFKTGIRDYLIRNWDQRFCAFFVNTKKRRIQRVIKFSALTIPEHRIFCDREEFSLWLKINHSIVHVVYTNDTSIVGLDELIEMKELLI